MENIENNLQDENSFFNNREIIGYLLETSKWGKFIAIVGYVLIGIFILLGIFVMFGFSQISRLSGTAYPMGLFGFLYILIAVAYYFPVNYLHKFSIQIKQGLNSKDVIPLSSGFQNLKSLFKFMGIFVIVILSIYALVLLIALPVMYFIK